MGLRRRLTFAVALLAAASAAAVACKTKPPPPKNEVAPVDHLAPDELVEGPEKAFGLPLPRVSRVRGRFATSAHVTSSATPEQLANFVRSRVTDGKVTPGTSSTNLENVIPRDDKNKRLSIQVRATKAQGDGSRSEMIIEDRTPPPFDPNLTEDQRWKKAGLVPGGNGLLDPKHLE